MNQNLPIFRLLIVACLLSCHLRCEHAQSQDALVGDHAGIDFCEHGAPACVHVFASPELRKLLQLNDDQQRRVDEALRAWTTTYVERKAQIDALPPEDTRGRRGWPPNRDRMLQSQIVDTLLPEQQSTFSKILGLWNLGPVHWSGGLRFQQDLKLSPKQLRELYALNVKWLLFGMPRSDAFANEANIGDRIEVYRSITAAGWEFKPERDKAWQNILTDEQAVFWRQLELQKWLQIDSAVILNDFSARSRDQLPHTGTLTDYLIPYFEPPVEVLRLTEEQKLQFQQILDSPGDVSVGEISQIEDREARRAALIRAGHQWSRNLRRMEDLMTDDQKKRWKSLVGESWLAKTLRKFEGLSNER